MNDHPAYSASEEESGHIQSHVNPVVIWKTTAVLALASLVINLGLYIVGMATDWIPDDLPSATENFSLISVVFASVIPVVIFGGLMVFLANNAPRASRLFTIILTVVLLLAVIFPLVLPDIESSFRMLLVAMHIVTAGSILLLTRTAEN